MTTIENSSATMRNGEAITTPKSLPFMRALHGALLALLIPGGWVVLQWFAGRDPFHATHFDLLLYSYIALVSCLVFAAIGYITGKREQSITDLALSDELTGLYNKRYFQTRLDQEFERFQRYGTPMSLVEIDLDHFKEINDTWGHPAGDAVLKAVAEVVTKNLRTGEIAARVGGEEICIIVANSSAKEAFQLAERLRKAIHDLKIEWQGDTIEISASLGIGEAEPTTLTKWQLYEHTDKALYQAKKHGRNLSMIFSTPATNAA